MLGLVQDETALRPVIATSPSKCCDDHLSPGSLRRLRASRAAPCGVLFIDEVKVHGPDIGLPRFRDQASSRVKRRRRLDGAATAGARRAHVVLRENSATRAPRAVPVGLAPGGRRGDMSQTRRIEGLFSLAR